MIKQYERTYLLSTKNTSLLLHIDDLRKPCTEYYGKRLSEDDDFTSLFSPYALPQGRTVTYPSDIEGKVGCLNDRASDFTTPLRGDFNSPSIVLRGEDSLVFDFQFVSSEIRDYVPMKGYPNPHDAGQELVLVCRDELMHAEIELHYVTFDEADVIGRYVTIRNLGEKKVIVNKAMSLQMFIDDAQHRIETFYGSWANEFNRESVEIKHAKYSFGSTTGSSSDFRNPFFMIRQRGTTYRDGEVYGFNLIYSGNHLEEIEKTTFGKIRIQSGMSDFCLNLELGKDEELITPMAVMSYAWRGMNQLMHHMHRFVNLNIVPKEWAGVPRPILYNNWEATYFNFNDGKLHAAAKAASKLGIELFVLDDGWFGDRNDDSHGLGDWVVNTKKLRHGLIGLSDYVHGLGMKFGLWFEPEAISPESELYKEHPDWAIQDGVHEPLRGRNQLTLDLTKKEVREFILSFLVETISEAKIDYIKWDYNRPMSDIPSSDGAFYHHYILGLYEILAGLREKFPNLLMENCASGGARNDLGMFCFFSQGWVSDNTDSFQRANIQSNMILGYPQSVMGNHVASKTSHQLLRKTSLGTKFDVACIGILGYELVITELDPVDKKELIRQIEFYKANRMVCQYGECDILADFDFNGFLATEVHDDSSALVAYVNRLQKPNPAMEHLRLVGLEDDAIYTYEVREEKTDIKKFGALVNMIAPIHIKEEGKLITAASRRYDMAIEKFSGTAKGMTLCSGGVKLPQQWSGVGLNDQIRVIGDFGGRVYLFKKKID